MNAAGDRLADLDLMVEKNMMQRFFGELVSDSGKATYGAEAVKANLDVGAVDVLLLSEDLRAEKDIIKCESCDYETSVIREYRPSEKIEPPGNCPKCGSTLRVVEKVDVVNELSGMCDQMGTEVSFISTDFDEGAQLMNAFGGIAAILRYSTGI